MGENGKKRGRPRSASTDLLILQATRALMLEFGMNNFSMDDVAARAGVSKPTIYLRWNSKDELITDAFGLAAEQTAIPDTGDALADLRALLENMLASMELSLGSAEVAPHKLVAGMLESPQLLEQYKQNFIAPRRKDYAKILKKGIQKGQIRKDIDEDTLIDLISGAYFYCMLFKPETENPSDWMQKAFTMIQYGISPVN
ncbi:MULTISPECIES: TetR/AcrR family transcriptional regulator [Paenibacillus]|uniref:TetR family transcriptional regulator n=1 Tax=Paenibacillus albilobatus TaxID=2716884 RepID=A0A919XLD6_9BACL|nr:MULTISPECIES: TetR/AcrR family transcriptional regulator [Paenibacillus]GIO35132.1 TetR family transcriptional regulator [Paenibacillus albilobatus]